MKLHLTRAQGNQLITGYGEGWIEVNETRYPHSLIVLPGQLLKDWDATDFENLTAAHFERLLALQPELVLLGTGTSHRFIHPSISRPLLDAGIGLECMTTAAACRTFNILMAEGRHVAAALLLR
jgi:uncharacterized protein